LTHSIQMRGCQLLKSDQPLDTARRIREEHLCPVAHLCPRSESKWSICVRLSHISRAATRGTARCVLVYLLVYSIALAVKLREINHIDAYLVSRSRSRLCSPFPFWFPPLAPSCGAMMFLENTLMDTRRAAAAGSCRMGQGFTVRLPPSRICVRCPPAVTAFA
jgi:hypothetical protein